VAELVKWVKLPLEADAFLDEMSIKWANVFISPEVLEDLRANPITRISYAWMNFCEGEGGLSPFAIAGITRISPKRVMTQAAKEPFMSCVDLCVTTLVPILFAKSLDPDQLSTWGGEFKNRFNADLATYGRDYGLDYEKDSFEEYMRKYGGDTWKRHCTRRFDPKEKGCEISPEYWTVLREFYLGRKLRGAVR
jgi:hypothetical protein